MLEYKLILRTKLQKIYSQDLLNIIFRHPYTKIQHIEKGVAVSRLTAAKYLDAIDCIGLLQKVKIGRENYFVNVKLMDLLGNAQKL